MNTNTSNTSSTASSTVVTVAAAVLSLVGPAIVVLLFASSWSPLSPVSAKGRGSAGDDVGGERSSGDGTIVDCDDPVDVIDNKEEGGRGGREAGGLVVPFFYSPPPPRDEDSVAAATDDHGANDNTEPPFRDLRRALHGYETDVRSALHALGCAEAVARESERALFGGGGDGGPIAAGIRERRGRLADVLEADGFVLEGLLRPFPVVRALPDCGGGARSSRRDDEGVESVCSHDSDGADAGASGAGAGAGDGDGGGGEFVLKYRSSPFHPAGGGGGGDETPADYDSAASVLSHVARDWSVIGRSARSSTYDWCISRLESHLPTGSGGGTAVVRVLVPGAGLARLARDVALAGNGYVVEANDRSVVMAAAAHAIINHDTGEGDGRGRGVIHPHAMEPFSNEVDPDQRYEAVTFPDDDDSFVGGGCDSATGRRDSPASCHHPRPPPRSRRGSMSYTVGDYVSTYASPDRRGAFDAVVTCFFLDTAESLFEYVAVIRNVLRRRQLAAPDGGDDDAGESPSGRGGIWINVGPLQWHRDAVVRPSVDELRSFIESTGDFDVLEWSVDDEVVPYGHDGEAGWSGGGGSKPRSTRFEGYRPLRFVVALRRDPAAGTGRYDDARGDVLAVRRSIDTMTTLGGGSGRRSDSRDHRGGRGDDAAWGRGRREHSGGDGGGCAEAMQPVEEVRDAPAKSSLSGGGRRRIELLEEDDGRDDGRDPEWDYDIVDDADLIIPDVN